MKYSITLKVGYIFEETYKIEAYNETDALYQLGKCIGVKFDRLGSDTVCSVNVECSLDTPYSKYSTGMTCTIQESDV